MTPELQEKVEALPAEPTGAARPHTLRAYLMLGLAFVTCPCHLPILAVLLAGTGAGAYLRQNLALSAAAMTALFVTSLVLGFRWIAPGGRGTAPECPGWAPPPLGPGRPEGAKPVRVPHEETTWRSK